MGVPISVACLTDSSPKKPDEPYHIVLDATYGRTGYEIQTPIRLFLEGMLDSSRRAEMPSLTKLGGPDEPRSGGKVAYLRVI
jgi:hypothetical protein